MRLRMWLCRGCGKMGMLRRLREWREKRDGTLEGPALHTEETQHTSEDGEDKWRTYVNEDGDLVDEPV